MAKTEMNPFKQTACQHFFSCFSTLFSGKSVEIKKMSMKMDTKSPKTGFYRRSAAIPCRHPIKTAAPFLRLAAMPGIERPSRRPDEGLIRDLCSRCCTASPIGIFQVHPHQMPAPTGE
jgi:hypothetical protein